MAGVANIVVCPLDITQRLLCESRRSVTERHICCCWTCAMFLLLDACRWRTAAAAVRCVSAAWTMLPVLEQGVAVLLTKPLRVATVPGEDPFKYRC